MHFLGGWAIVVVIAGSFVMLTSGHLSEPEAESVEGLSGGWAGSWYFIF